MQLKFEHPNYISTGIIRGWMLPFVYYPNKTKTKVVKKKDVYPKRLLAF